MKKFSSKLPLYSECIYFKPKKLPFLSPICKSQISLKLKEKCSPHPKKNTNKNSMGFNSFKPKNLNLSKQKHLQKHIQKQKQKAFLFDNNILLKYIKDLNDLNKKTEKLEKKKIELQNKLENHIKTKTNLLSPNMNEMMRKYRNSCSSNKNFSSSFKEEYNSVDYAPFQESFQNLLINNGEKDLTTNNENIEKIHKASRTNIKLLNINTPKNKDKFLNKKLSKSPIISEIKERVFKNTMDLSIFTEVKRDSYITNVEKEVASKVTHDLDLNISEDDNLAFPNKLRINNSQHHLIKNENKQIENNFISESIKFRNYKF